MDPKNSSLPMVQYILTNTPDIKCPRSSVLEYDIKIHLVYELGYCLARTVVRQMGFGKADLLTVYATTTDEQLEHVKQLSAQNIMGALHLIEMLYWRERSLTE